MRTPDPDALLTGIVDAGLARIQQAGTPLPILIARSRMAVIASLSGFGIVLVAAGQFGTALLYGGLVCWLAPEWGDQIRRLVADGRRWRPGMAGAYRATAAHVRERGRTLRVARMLGVMIAATLAASALTSGWAEAGTVALLVALALVAGVSCLDAYVDCAMPRDPDTRELPELPELARLAPQ